MNPLIELEERYPSADFSVYFRTAEACRTVKGLNTHDHHLCPRKQFPEFVDSPENLITVTIEDHAFLHKLLEAACGIKAPPTAYFEAQEIAAALGGKTMWSRMSAEQRHDRGVLLGKSSWKGMTGTQRRKRRENCVSNARAAMLSLPQEERKERAKRAGSANARATHVKAGRLGAKSLSLEQRKKGGSRATHLRWHAQRGVVSSACVLCTL